MNFTDQQITDVARTMGELVATRFYATPGFDGLSVDRDDALARRRALDVPTQEDFKNAALVAMNTGASLAVVSGKRSFGGWLTRQWVWA